MAVDIGATTWQEDPADNNQAAPDGAPEGMAPSGVNDVLRQHQAAGKRFWNRLNAVKTTGGTSSAYTLTYDEAAAAYYDGEIHTFVANATNAAGATLNINGLGAIPLRLFGGNLLPGAIIADQIVQVRYNSSAAAFDILGGRGWQALSTQSVSAQATIDFEDIPTAVNHIQVVFAGTISQDGAEVHIRTYGADGNLDTEATDYISINLSARNDNTTNVVSGSGSSGKVIGLADNGHPVSFELSAANIQAAIRTVFTYRSSWLDSVGILSISAQGIVRRQEDDRISGLQILTSGGTMTGRATMLALE